LKYESKRDCNDDRKIKGTVSPYHDVCSKRGRQLKDDRQAGISGLPEQPFPL